MMTPPPDPTKGEWMKQYVEKLMPNHTCNDINTCISKKHVFSVCLSAFFYFFFYSFQFWMCLDETGSFTSIEAIHQHQSYSPALKLIVCQ